MQGVCSVAAIVAVRSGEMLQCFPNANDRADSACDSNARRSSATETHSKCKPTRCTRREAVCNTHRVHEASSEREPEAGEAEAGKKRHCR